MNKAIIARFARLTPLIDRALELHGEARERFLSLCAEIHPDLINDLRRSLAEDDALPQLGGLAAEVTDSPSTANRPGLRVGSWRLLERIGQGGMGSVYRAERADGAFEMEVAIKLLRGGDPRFQEQLTRERRLLARLDHPGIARLIDGGMLPDGQPWLAMELAEGEALDDWLAQVRPDLIARLRTFLAICDAVACAHRAGIVHRDLKPANIRVGTGGQVKLLDFGIARLLASDAQTGTTRHIALTPEFAAPEQLGGGSITPRTDVHALGTLLYLLLTGTRPHPPFTGDWPGYADARQTLVPEPVRHILAHADDGDAVTAARALAPIVTAALALDPLGRPASAMELATNLRRKLLQEPALSGALLAPGA